MANKNFTIKALDEMAEVLAVRNSQINNAKMHMDRNAMLAKQAEKELQGTLDGSKIMDNDAFIASLGNAETYLFSEGSRFEDGLSEEIDCILNEVDNAMKEKTLFSEARMALEKLEVISEVDDWFELVNESRSYEERHKIGLEDPYDQLFSNYENAQIRHGLIEKFSLSQLDKDDYAVAAGAGILAGIVDAIFVGTIGKGGNVSKLQGWTDDKYGEIVDNFAERYRASDQINKLDKSKMSTETYREAKERIWSSVSEKSHKSNIKYLEERFKVLYDTTGGNNSKFIDGSLLDGMNTNNHHLLSLSHDPGPLGLVFSIIDQLTQKASFIDVKGNLTFKTTQNNNLLNGEEVKGIIDAVHNWFGHCLSDVSGSNSSKYRGSGLPAPFASVLQKLQFGNIPVDNDGKTVTLAKLSEQMYKEGYDARAFTAQLLPVLVYEVIVRTFWFFKQHFYYGKSVKESLPIGNNPDLQRMLFISATSFTAIDTGHAAIKSGFAEPITFFMTLNYPGLINFGFKSLQSTRYQIKHIQKLTKFDADIQAEWDRLILRDM